MGRSGGAALRLYCRSGNRLAPAPVSFAMGGFQ